MLNPNRLIKFFLRYPLKLNFYEAFRKRSLELALSFKVSSLITPFVTN